MGVRKWVMAGVGSVAIALLGAAASAGGGGGAPASDAGAVVGIARAEVDQDSTPSCMAIPGRRAELRPAEGHGDLFVRLTDRLVYVEEVFANGTPGSPAQFRAREEADSLREQLCSIGGAFAPR